MKALRALSLLPGLLLAPVAAEEVVPLFETEPNSVIDRLESLFAVFGAEEEYDESQGLNSSYIPAVFYTPEQGLGVGLLYVGLYGETEGGTLQPSSVVLNPYVSTNGSIGLSTEATHFFNRGDDRFHLEFKVRDDTAVFYGIGYDQGQQDDNKIDYSERLLTLEPMWLTRIGGHLFAGVGANLEVVRPHEVELEGGVLPPPDQLVNNTSYGAFVTGVYDSRDNTLSASEGMYLKAELGAYYDDTNGNSFGAYNLAASQYLSLAPGPGLLAWQVRADLTSGEVPWNRLPDLGGDDAMRGYIQGRYRDNQMMMAQVEYRLPIYWRLGMVFWGAAGTVAEDVSGLWDDTLASYGTGFRLKVKDKVNVRADIGFGEHETTFYFHVNEVF
ncbi:BamA/TamA family outer membrane protein [Ferrimonas balearica]|uniref:BamA/TamA family outer membrane protein n=1 Tax=Ferrimonas balearica TaxID=44012 RepID=UPI001C98FEF9|nr:BamA/TamA family outer membrane protein [Ferrimonas balearica]MBY5991769.1 hypothetical protein [Ferrimonas balearica]